MSLHPRTALVLLLGTALGLALSLTGVALTDRHVQVQARSGLSLLGTEDLRLLDEVLSHVQREYVDDIDSHRLVESAIRGILGELDMHSQFLDAAQLDDLMVGITGLYGGIGLELESLGERVWVGVPMHGTPAQRAGILPGDVLLAIDGQPVGGKGDAVSRLRGRPGSLVTLTLMRDGNEQPLVVTIERERIVVSTVRAESLSDGYGYLRITQFSQSTPRELRDALSGLHAQAGGRLRGLILDLRNNPGGVLEAAVDVADAFLDTGLIVRGEGRLEGSSFERHAKPGDVLDGAGLIVLVNSGSASASEIVAGALQDHGRAILVGSVTHGKGSVQSVVPLPDGTALKLTTSRYFTPSGATIHEQGLQPDLEVFQSTVYGPSHLDLDVQLQEALQWLRNRTTVALHLL